MRSQAASQSLTPADLNLFLRSSEAKSSFSVFLPKCFVAFDLDKSLPKDQAAGTMDSVLASHPAAQGLIPSIPKNFSEFLMLPRLIDGAAA